MVRGLKALLARKFKILISRPLSPKLLKAIQSSGLGIKAKFFGLRLGIELKYCI